MKLTNATIREAGNLPSGYAIISKIEYLRRGGTIFDGDTPWIVIVIVQMKTETAGQDSAYFEQVNREDIVEISAAQFRAHLLMYSESTDNRATQ